MRRLLAITILALSVAIIAPPAAAQETTTADGQNHDGIDTPAYQSPEEDAINARIQEADAEYARLEAEVARLEDELGPLSGRDQIAPVEDQMEAAEDTVRQGAEDLAATRLDLITDEEISGPPDRQRSQLQRADQALETLADYGGEWLPYESELPTAIAEAREGVAYQLAELEAAEDQRMEDTGGEAVGQAPPEPESQPLADPDSSSDSGSDGSDIPGYTPGGPLAFLGGITGSLLPLVATFALVFGAMFGLAYRRERDAQAAWDQTATKKKLIIAAILAVLLGGLSIWTALTVVIAIAILAIPTVLIINMLWGRPGESRVETIARLVGGRELSPGSPPEEPPPPPPDGSPDGPTVGGPEDGGQDGQGARWAGDTSHLKKGPPPEPRKWEMTPELRERLRGMEAIMAESIVGQQDAVREVAASLRRRIAGGFGGDRPASFMFVGPTGVGKTEVVNVLAQEMYGGTEAMIRLDMSEYKNPVDITRLTGASPGYIGHDSPNPLTEAIYENPNRVILFDEIEKAHPDIWTIMLQILDAGRLTDSHGNLIPFAGCTIVLTSNLLAREIGRARQAGEDIDPADLKEDLIQEGVRPEVVNRLGRIVVFDPLSANEVQEVAARMLTKTTEQMQKEHGVDVGFTDAAIARIAELGYEPDFGARPLRAVIEREVEDRLSDLVLDERIGRGSGIEFDVREGGEIGIRGKTPR